MQQTMMELGGKLVWTKTTGESLCSPLGSVWGADFRGIAVPLSEFGTTFGILFHRRRCLTVFGA